MEMGVQTWAQWAGLGSAGRSGALDMLDLKGRMHVSPGRAPDGSAAGESLGASLTWVCMLAVLSTSSGTTHCLLNLSEPPFFPQGDAEQWDLLFRMLRRLNKRKYVKGQSRCLVHSIW